MAVLRLFAAARTATGTGRVVLPGATVADVLAEAEARYGPEFTEVMTTAKVWRNGAETHGDAPVTDQDEVAVLPPLSGGCV